MNKAEEVIKRLEKECTIFTIKLTGDRENNASGFYIMMLNQSTTSAKKYVFYGIREDTIELLKEAEIKFEVVGR